MRIRFVVSFVLALALAQGAVLACSCVSPPPDVKTARDLAKWYASRSDAVFEGAVERIDFKWNVVDAKVGDLLPADMDQEPALQVTFRVSRWYRGAGQNSIVITTGVGGGDCGFGFEVGKQYLVYAYIDDLGQLSTGICSGTGALEDSQVDLSYLRGEPVSHTPEHKVAHQAGKVCGHVASSGLDLSDSQIFLIRVGNKSPMPSDEAEPDNNGSFCFSETEPGSYYLAFISRREDSPISFALFPGLTQFSKATAIEVVSGHTPSDLEFEVPPESTFSIRGHVLASNGEVLPSGCKVLLLRAELPLSFLLSYTQDVGQDGSFGFLQVLPGKYWALVMVGSDAAPRWLTKKAEIEVNADVGGLWLDLLEK